MWSGEAWVGCEAQHQCLNPLESQVHLERVGEEFAEAGKHLRVGVASICGEAQNSTMVQRLRRRCEASPTINDHVKASARLLRPASKRWHVPLVARDNSDAQGVDELPRFRDAGGIAFCKPQTCCGQVCAPEPSGRPRPKHHVAAETDLQDFERLQAPAVCLEVLGVERVVGMHAKLVRHWRDTPSQPAQLRLSRRHVERGSGHTHNSAGRLMGQQQTRCCEPCDDAHAEGQAAGPRFPGLNHGATAAQLRHH